jgi:hypothetical protein
VITYVAETKEKAEEEAVEHIRYFFEDALRTTPTFLAPPGYLSVDQLKKARGARRQAARRFSFQNINESFFVAVGTADQVVEQLEGWAEKMGTNHFVIFGAIGNMPHWKVVKNLNLIAQDVIPRMRARAAAQHRVPLNNTKEYAHGSPGSLAGFEREVHTVNGVKTVVLTAGRGEPLVFLHGAGTWHGFKFALPWAEKYRVIIPSIRASVNPTTIPD